MKLSECTIGTLVKERRIPGGSQTASLRIGHVVGLEVNNVGETIPTIRFAKPFPDQDYAATGYNHHNLDKLTD